MDLTQSRLTAEEWTALEILVPPSEMKILKLIKSGYENVNISYNDTLTLINFSKISGELDKYHNFFYEKYFEGKMNKLQKKYKFDVLKFDKKKKKTNLKKAEIIRIKNIEKKVENLKDDIYEFVLLSFMSSFLKHYKNKSDKFQYYYYTLTQVLRYNVSNLNKNLEKYIRHILEFYCSNLKKKDFIKNSSEFIEKNSNLSKYRDISLYEHQKKVITYCKQKGPKLILYKAPTGTGKTLTPVGLSKKHRIIFVCAAKHIGLQLAKALVSVEAKIAVAFGCEDPGGIRLHYYAAKDYVKNRRTGGIFRVDNSVGDDVEVIISDIESYLPAMNYMMAFNKAEDIVWYWDEPTITLDYENHEFHDILKRNWNENMIPNVVLSSATLPKQEEISSFCQSFMIKFKTTNLYDINSNDCAKTIPILNSKGEVVLPHYMFDSFEKVKKCVKHIKNYSTILRHFDLKEISKFIIYINKNLESLKKRYKVENYFEKIDEIDSISLKEYYLKLLLQTKDNYEEIYSYFKNKRKPLHDSTIKITTNDSYTLTNGPTIYLADDVEKIAKYCLQSAKIPRKMLESILEDIYENDNIAEQIASIENELNKEELQADSRKGSDRYGTGKSKKEKNISKNGNTGKETQNLQEKLEGLRARIRDIQLAEDYIPNSFAHLRLWNKENTKNAFTSSISDSIIRKIMLLDVDSLWKFLLMMGIGVFKKHGFTDVKKKKAYRDYAAIMSQLANEQHLYLIIASTDYIYGTNYQFCHGYISKDLENLTQEKTIQAFGRIGRSNARQEYSIRMRNDNLIYKLFTKQTDKMEVKNMNKLFC
jgi:hypothetical protein|uniref:Helicase ATP-binding domain-containing protein n=1 Tax=viral metagenome TaxID=1070528 RepID=A0A6C0BZB1_9ZZZZ